MAMVVKTGTTLTIAHEIIGLSGQILFTKDQKVVVEKLYYSGGFRGKQSGTYYPKKLTTIKLVDHNGIWFHTCFKELRDENN